LIEECGCPKGNPLAVPPVYAQKCDSDGDCYCESEEMDFREDGCYLGSTCTFSVHHRDKNGE